VQNGDRVGDGIGVDRRRSGFDDGAEALQQLAGLLDGGYDLGVGRRPRIR
jgi:hypothetical protein